MILKTLKNVEIFRVGKWKGTQYTASHLDEMVRNFQLFKDSWFRPAVKAGHGESPGQKATGYLDNIRREGDVLMADFVDVPVEIHETIKQRNYDRVSIEIVPKLESEGKVYRNVIWSLALLGVEVPEVSGLKPLRTALATLSSDTEVVSLQTFLSVGREIVYNGKGGSYGSTESAYLELSPDAAYAVIEPGGEKGENGNTTPQALRHLPHHDLFVTDPDDNDSVEIPRLIKVMKKLQAEIPDELQSEAKHHLEQHARSLGIDLEKEKKDMNVNQDDKDKNVTLPTLKAVDMSAAETVKMQAQMKEQADKITKLSADLEASTKHAHELEEKGRQERIGRKVDELRLPALRTYARVFYDWATKSDNKPIKFSKDGKEADVLPETVVDEFIDVLNKASESLLLQHSNEPVFKRDDAPVNDDPGTEVDRRTRELMSKQTNLDYNAALQIVFSKDPELKKRYALN